MTAPRRAHNTATANAAARVNAVPLSEPSNGATRRENATTAHQASASEARGRHHARAAASPTAALATTATHAGVESVSVPADSSARPAPIAPAESTTHGCALARKLRRWSAGGGSVESGTSTGAVNATTSSRVRPRSWRATCSISPGSAPVSARPAITPRPSSNAGWSRSAVRSRSASTAASRCSCCPRRTRSRCSSRAVSRSRRTRTTRPTVAGSTPTKSVRKSTPLTSAQPDMVGRSTARPTSSGSTAEGDHAATPVGAERVRREHQREQPHPATVAGVGPEHGLDRRTEDGERRDEAERDDRPGPAHGQNTQQRRTADRECQQPGRLLAQQDCLGEPGQHEARGDHRVRPGQPCTLRHPPQPRSTCSVRGPP